MDYHSENIGEEFIDQRLCVSVVIPTKIMIAISLWQIIFVHKSLLRYTFLFLLVRVILVFSRLAL